MVGSSGKAHALYVNAQVDGPETLEGPILAVADEGRRSL